MTRPRLENDLQARGAHGESGRTVARVSNLEGRWARRTILLPSLPLASSSSLSSLMRRAREGGLVAMPKKTVPALPLNHRLIKVREEYRSGMIWVMTQVGKWSCLWLQHTDETHLASQPHLELCSYILAVPKWFDRNCCWQKRFRFAPAACARPLAQVGTTWSHRHVVRRSLRFVEGTTNANDDLPSVFPRSRSPS